MASKKSRPPVRGVVKGKSPVTVAPSSTEWGRAEILLETIRDENRTTYEAVLVLKDSMDRRFAEMKAELGGRIDVLESVVRGLVAEVRKNSEDIRKNSEDIRKNSEDIRKNSEDILRMDSSINAMRVQLEGKIDAADFRKLEARVAALEARLAS